MTSRLIETWLPIVEIGIESVRERRSITALPPIYVVDAAALGGFKSGGGAQIFN